MFNGLLAIDGFPRPIGVRGKPFEWKSSGRCLNVWVLFEFGVKESWTKIFDVSLSSETPERSVSFWRNRVLFVQNLDGELVLYNLQTHSKKFVLQIPGNPSFEVVNPKQYMDL